MYRTNSARNKQIYEDPEAMEELKKDMKEAFQDGRIKPNDRSESLKNYLLEKMQEYNENPAEYETEQQILEKRVATELKDPLSVLLKKAAKKGMVHFGFQGNFWVHDHYKYLINIYPEDSSRSSMQKIRNFILDNLNPGVIKELKKDYGTIVETVIEWFRSSSIDQYSPEHQEKLVKFLPRPFLNMFSGTMVKWQQEPLIKRLKKQPISLKAWKYATNKLSGNEKTEANKEYKILKEWESKGLIKGFK